MSSKGYVPKPVVVKYVKLGWFHDTCYRSFDSEEEALEWLNQPVYAGVGVGPKKIEKWAIYRISEVSP